MGDLNEHIGAAERVVEASVGLLGDGVLRSYYEAFDYMDEQVDLGLASTQVSESLSVDRTAAAIGFIDAWSRRAYHVSTGFDSNEPIELIVSSEQQRDFCQAFISGADIGRPTTSFLAAIPNGYDDVVESVLACLAYESWLDQIEDDRMSTEAILFAQSVSVELRRPYYQAVASECFGAELDGQ